MGHKEIINFSGTIATGTTQGISSGRISRPFVITKVQSLLVGIDLEWLKYDLFVANDGEVLSSVPLSGSRVASPNSSPMTFLCASGSDSHEVHADITEGGRYLRIVMTASTLAATRLFAFNVEIEYT